MSADSLQGIAIFVQLAEMRSFTGVARRLGISVSGASKSITRLEQRLGIRLVNRTTRNVSLTDDGAAFFQRCRQILLDLDDAENTVTRRRAKPRGHLRVQMPVEFGRRVIAPLLAQFVESNPELVVDVELSDGMTDLAEEGLDAVVRVGNLRDSGLIARKLCNVNFVTVASPAYLEQYGEPQTPDDLQRHRCLGFYIPRSNRYRSWSFASDGQRFLRSMPSQLNYNNGQTILDAAIAGAGIANLTTFVAADAVRAGSLRMVLHDYVSVGPPISVVYLSQRHLSLRVQAFVNFLTRNISMKPSWDKILELR